ncbi:stage II sporulation protein P [Sporolactobacillus laevolacticus]|uniref:Stage II sporulation protein P n=1 Tax=Sporolactobacillus laevolacticus DSM 442 TaxID=1395513 RepID=V6IUD0_9BACL|nr:stage II sporulation protein P [Sporolactobacillus laevolacticus]EST10555.1 stage II sporulation protein P [Sporolactobacillus laevolacticus DSM 442]
MKKLKSPHSTQSSINHSLLFHYLFVLILIYGLAILVTVSQVKIGFIEDTLQKADWPAKVLLTETFGNENVLFNQAIKKQDRPKTVYHLLFEAMTELRFDDNRSLFGSELPGFTIYNTRIFIAGKGLNYTNLPKDNPPSPEINIEPPKEKTPQENAKDVPDQKLKKVVLLYHTHPWESYKPMNSGQDSTYTDPLKSVAKDADIIGKTLSENGVGYIHKYKQGWGYNEAYAKSRIIVQDALKQTPTLNYLIDIHRDSSGRSVTTMNIGSTSYARISIIIGEANPNYSANLYLAKQVKNQIDKKYPDLVRGIVGKTKLEGNGIYNQDLSKNAILVEIGGVDNNLQEITRSSKAFGEALAQVIKQNK